MTIFPLTLHKTYYNSGFFNVTVQYDSCVRRSEGTVMLIVGDRGQRIQARVDRSANPNNTARIMGGAALRDWFQQRCRLKDTVYVDLSSMREIRITKTDPAAHPK